MQSLSRTASSSGASNWHPDQVAKAIQLGYGWSHLLVVTSGSGQAKVGKTEARGLIEKEPVGLYFIHSVGD